MTTPIARDPIYRRCRFQPETIELCVRWYLTYRLSYRDLVEMMAERGITLSHSTILRWVQRYVPEFERRWDRYARRVHSSWRMDETAVWVRGGARYLYRAVDKHGKTVDSLLCADRSESSARAFLTKALETHSTGWPDKLNLDGDAASHRALCLLRQENPAWSVWYSVAGISTTSTVRVPSDRIVSMAHNDSGVAQRSWKKSRWSFSEEVHHLKNLFRSTPALLASQLYACYRTHFRHSPASAMSHQ